MSTKNLTIVSPDDWHLHVRTGNVLKTVVPFTSGVYRRALIMPNLKPPVTTVEQAFAYRNEVLDGADSGFEPYMTLYLTDNTSPDEIKLLSDTDFVLSVKYYPAGATTNSDSGVSNIKNVYPVLSMMEELGVPLNIHGEVTYGDIFGREKEFIKKVLIPLRKKFPKLKIILEHITTKFAVDYITEAKGKIAATITPQHLMFNRNQLLVGGIKPHFYCLPILKKNRDRKSLIKAATSGNKRFFLGTDSAPHLTNTKENSCGCAGCFSPYSLQMYAQVFEEAKALDKLEGFASIHGAEFYGLPINGDKITLVRDDFKIDDEIIVEGNQTITPLFAGETLNWKILEEGYD